MTDYTANIVKTLQDATMDVIDDRNRPHNLIHLKFAVRAACRRLNELQARVTYSSGAGGGDQRMSETQCMGDMPPTAEYTAKVQDELNAAMENLFIGVGEEMPDARRRVRTAVRSAIRRLRDLQNRADWLSKQADSEEANE